MSPSLMTKTLMVVTKAGAAEEEEGLGAVGEKEEEELGLRRWCGQAYRALASCKPLMMS